MKTIILTTFTLLYLGLIHAQLSPSQKTELATYQKSNFKFNAGIGSISQTGVIRTSYTGQIPYSIYPTSSEGRYAKFIDVAFDMLRDKVDIRALQRTPIHFYFVTDFPINLPPAQFNMSEIPGVLAHAYDLIHSGVISYTRIHVKNFDKPDYRIVIQVPEGSPDPEVLVGNILKGVARILYEGKIGPEEYWSKHPYRPANVTVDYQFLGSKLSQYATTSTNAFVSEYFAIWVMDVQNYKVEKTLHKAMSHLYSYYEYANGPRLLSRN